MTKHVLDNATVVIAHRVVRLNPSRGPATTCEACGYCDHVSPYGGHRIKYCESVCLIALDGYTIVQAHGDVRQPHLHVGCAKCGCEWLVEAANAAAVIGLRT